MSSALKKHGLSDTLHQLKDQISNQASRVSHKQQSSRSKKTQPASFMVSKFQLLPEQEEQKCLSVLDALIDLVSFKQREACVAKQHDYNPTKYICLEENCSRKIGCSYCFLEAHSMHPKIETQLCLKDLFQMKEKVNQNRAAIKQELVKRRIEAKQNIKKQLSKIKEQFMNNLDYLNSKIGDILDKQFNQKLSQLDKIPQKQNKCHKQNLLKQNVKTPQKQQRQTAQSEFHSILQAFNAKPSTDILLASHLQRNSLKPRLKEARKQQFSTYNLSEEDELNLLSKLSKLSFIEVDQFLKSELLVTHQFCKFLHVFNDFYIELGASLSEFFATFKRAVPVCPSLQNSMKEPDILKTFSF